MNPNLRSRHIGLRMGRQVRVLVPALGRVPVLGLGLGLELELERGPSRR